MGKAEDLARAFGFLWEVEVPVLKHLARLLGPSPTIINIGAGPGTSALAFLEARPDSRVCTVDIENGITPFGGLGNERGALTEAGYFPHVRFTQILGDSADAGRAWPHGKVDMVFVDGDHSEAGVLRDIDAWLPHLRAGGIIAFHDVGEHWGEGVIGVISAIGKRESLFGDLVARISLIAAYYIKDDVPEKIACWRMTTGNVGVHFEYPHCYPALTGFYEQGEPESRRWALEHIAEDWVCIDAGAHIGMYSMLYAYKAHRGRVIAVEPCAETADMLRANVSYNTRRWYRRFANMSIAPYALHERSGRFVEKVWLTGNAEGERELDFITLDDLVDGLQLDRLDLVKTDCDGYDLEALRGAKQTIKRFRPIIQSEINYALEWRKHTEQDAAALLASWGYDHRVLDRENWLCWPRDDEYKRMLCTS